MRLGVLIIMLLACGIARGETAPDLVRAGEELARDGHYLEAVATFKRAEALAPAPTHACLIGLAYLRAERWSQAEVFFATCRERTPHLTELPSWLVLAERQLDEHLHVGQFAPVAIRVEPADDAVVSISSFEADEMFSTRLVHLPAGRYVITATAPGRARVQTALSVSDAQPREVVLRFSATRPSRIPWIVGGAGAALLVAGGIYDAAALAPVRATLVTAGDPAHPDPGLYDRNSATFDRRRDLTLALYGLGAAAVIAGVALHYTVFRDRESPVQISGELHDHGAMVGIAWRR